MNIKGTVIQVLAVQTGAGKNGEWKKQEFIIETDGQYPKKICIALWGDKVGTVQSGQIVDVQIDAESREYNGRWYTELKAWKVDVQGTEKGVSGNQNSPSQQSEPQQGGEATDDLPF